MLRTLLTISLIFSLSLFSNMSYVYAPCRPGHGDGGGDSGRSHSGGGGGMSGAAGAAAGLGLLFNVLQSTKAQEDDADVGVDLDELAREYATAFNLMDPTVSLKLNYSLEIDDSDIIVLRSGSKIVVIEECSCGGGNCTCPREDACGVLFWKKTVSDWVDKFWGDFWEYNPDSEAVAVFEDTLRDYEERLNKAEEKCNIPSGASGGGTGVATAQPGCSCNAVGNNCVCPEAFACGGARHVVQWDGESGGVLSAEWVCGGASSGGAGVAIDEPPPEDTYACGCDGSNCTCPVDDACNTQFLRVFARWYSGKAMDATPGSEEAQKYANNWNLCREELEKRLKECTTPGSASSGGTGVAIDEPPPEDSPVCRCDTNGCVCPHDGACFVSTMTGAALHWSGKAMDATPGSEEAREYADKWNLSREELEKRLKECKGEIPRSNPPGFTTPAIIR